MWDFISFLFDHGIMYVALSCSLLFYRWRYCFLIITACAYLPLCTYIVCSIAHDLHISGANDPVILAFVIMNIHMYVHIHYWKQKQSYLTSGSYSGGFIIFMCVVKIQYLPVHLKVDLCSYIQVAIDQLWNCWTSM